MFICLLSVATGAKGAAWRLLTSGRAVGCPRYSRSHRAAPVKMYNVQCSAVQCSAVQCSVVQCSAVQCSAVQCSVVQCSAVDLFGCVLCAEMLLMLTTLQFSIRECPFISSRAACTMKLDPATFTCMCQDW